MTTQETKPSSAAYELATRETRQLSERLEDLLNELPDNFNGNIHWGHVGSIGHVNTLLSEAVSHLQSCVKEQRPGRCGCEVYGGTER